MSYSGYIRKAIESCECRQCRETWLAVLKPRPRAIDNVSMRVIDGHVWLRPHGGGSEYRACDIQVVE